MALGIERHVQLEREKLPELPKQWINVFKSQHSPLKEVDTPQSVAAAEFVCKCEGKDGFTAEQGHRSLNPDI